MNPYAFELAQVSVQIGFLAWRRDNGLDNDRSPVLQNLDGFQNEDALLVPHFRSKAKTLKEAQAGEHKGDDALKFYTEREWPKCYVIVGNPPFLGGSRLWEELGREYQQELWRVYKDRVSGFADLCCYWFEKARDAIKEENASGLGCWLRKESVALEMIGQPNPTGLPNSDVVRPWINGQDITRRWSEFWIIDFPPNTTLEQAAGYAAPFNYSETNVKPEREKNKRGVYRERWWIHAEPRPEMRGRSLKARRFVSARVAFVTRRHHALRPSHFHSRMICSPRRPRLRPSRPSSRRIRI